MAAEDLREQWEAHPDWHEQENRAAREAALPTLLNYVQRLRAGELDVVEFRTLIDSQSKQSESAVWGFRGNAGVMFFTMLVKAAAEELGALLPELLPAPADDAAAKNAIDRLRRLARATKERTGNNRIYEAFAPFFLSFFWEAQDRDQWPMFHPASREGLQHFGLLEIPDDVSDAYVAFRHAMLDACATVEADVWDLEQFLFRVKEAGQEPPATTTAPAAATSTDLYAHLADQGLTFPESLVTTLILSLLAKRFVILAGISGTGKTQLPLQLADYLSKLGTGATVVEPLPESDEHTLYLEATASTFRYGTITLPRKYVDFIDLPERGTGADFDVQVPTGAQAKVRIQNVGFSREAAHHARLTVLRTARAWLTDVGSVGDIVVVRLDDEGHPVALDHRPRTTTTTTQPIKRHELIAARSDWTDPRGLLGYWNPLTESYSRTQLVRILLQAGEDPEHPYLVILDEMNLARVEYYFSDFLSALESGEAVQLFDPAFAEVDDDVPPAITVPENVLFIGTVNVDETTHAFSPKVLDRANVIEFDKVDLAASLGLEEAPPTTGYRLKQGALSPALLAERPAPTDDARATVLADTELVADILRIHTTLETARRHFGYRVLNELLRYTAHAVERVDGTAEEVARQALDHQLVQKVLPKLTGGRELQETLTQLLDICVRGETTAAPSTSESLGDAAAAEGDDETGSGGADVARYPFAARKLRRMIERLEATGYVTFLE